MYSNIQTHLQSDPAAVEAISNSLSDAFENTIGRTLKGFIPREQLENLVPAGAGASTLCVYSQDVVAGTTTTTAGTATATATAAAPDASSSLRRTEGEEQAHMHSMIPSVEEGVRVSTRSKVRELMRSVCEGYINAGWSAHTNREDSNSSASFARFLLSYRDTAPLPSAAAATATTTTREKRGVSSIITAPLVCSSKGIAARLVRIRICVGALSVLLSCLTLLASVYLSLSLALAIARTLTVFPSLLFYLFPLPSIPELHYAI